MLVSLLQCKQGVWTGHPELGLWCNTMPPNASLISEEIIILHSKTFKQANKDPIIDYRYNYSFNYRYNNTYNYNYN